MFGLAHFDIAPILYGVVIFIGLMSMWYKLINGKYGTLAIEVFIFWLVFRLHGGTMAGGFAATVAALLAGSIFPLFLGDKK